MFKLSETVTRKYTETLDVEDWEIETDTGWVSINSISKTVPYKKWSMETETGKKLEAADTHIVFNEDYQEVFIQDLVPNKSSIMTKDGPELVTNLHNTNQIVEMFDMEVDSDNHRFYTNDILSHNSVTTVTYLLHYALFNDNVVIVILANKATTARKILKRLKFSYMMLPSWLKQGVTVWNEGDIQFTNGSRVYADATTSTNVRGESANIIYLDEFAFVKRTLAEDFFASVYPTISSGKTSKVIISSTPNGLNHFYKMWKDATSGKSKYTPFEIHFSAVPGRDEKWKTETIANLGEERFRQEYETEFIGSTNTLISPAKLKTLVALDVISQLSGLDIYEMPIDGHTYTIMVDVARGQGLDYSAFSVIDVTSIPYKQIAKYRSNEISSMIYPTVIYNAARFYKDAFVLIEISDIGQQVADILHWELEYENVIKVSIKPKAGQQVTDSGNENIQLGVKTSTATKRIGCSNLKTLIESDKLIINDGDTIMELTAFTAQKASFQAEEGYHDDLAMSLVIFGWYAAQRYFKEAQSQDIRKVLQKEQMKLVEEDDMVPFGIINNGIDIQNDQDLRDLLLFKPKPTEIQDEIDTWIKIGQDFHGIEDILRFRNQVLKK